MTKMANKFVALMLFFWGMTCSTDALAQRKVTIAFQIPLEHHLAQNVIFFKKEIETLSNNDVLVEINDYGSYLKDIADDDDLGSEKQYFLEKDMFEAVLSRKVEVGMISLSRISQLIPSADIFNQPFLIDSENKVADVVAKDSIVRRSIENSLKKLGIITLWWQPYGSVVFVSNGLPVKNPDQMKDKKVRVFGETLGNLVLASGGKPMAIPNSLQYFAYKHRKVDIGMTTVADIKAKKIWEVMDTISLTNSANMQFLMIANGNWWNSVSSNLKKMILKAALSAEEKSVQVLKNIEVESYKESIENGMSIALLSSDDRDFWREKSAPIYKAFLEKTGSDGQLMFDSITGY